jgi:hypothetical protein
LILRDARKPNWQRGVRQAHAVICDSVTAEAVPKTSRAIVFPVLSEASINELAKYQEFISKPSSVSHR